MFIKLNEFLARWRGQEGGVSAEYVAVIVIVAALIAAVWSTNIAGKTKECAEGAVGKLFTTEAQSGQACPAGDDG